MKRIALLLIALIISAPAFCQDMVIPKPNKIETLNGSYTIKDLKVYVEDSKIKTDLESMITLKLSEVTGLKVEDASKSSSSIKFITDESLAQDNYVLEVSSKGITSKASSYGGHFYALQTLLQLLPKEVCGKEVIKEKLLVPCCKIEDGPRFGWRGVLLDFSRHWFTKEDAKRYMDEIATYKMNVFHMHLTDDQGWRIEIDTYPELTRKCSMRAARVGQWWTYERQADDEPSDYGGFFTKDDIRELLEYARVRNITIMPEIDVPGHSLAATVAYPELACQTPPKFILGGSKFLPTDVNTLCAGNEKSFEFMEGVIKEVAELFPCGYIHIGGDECNKTFWGNCQKCKDRMKHEHLASLDELQSYFIKRIEKIVNKYGKRIVGWDEILEGGLAEDATVMSWRGMEGGIEAAKAGHHVIMTPTQHCYIDLYQGEKSVEPDTYSMLRLSQSYAFEPVPDGIDSKYILGGQANLWTESVPTIRHAEYMTWPRTWAISESLWTNPENKNWMSFVGRVENHFLRAEEAEINVANQSMYNAIVTPHKDGTIEIKSEIEDVEIYYTFDNTNADKYTPKYEKPLTIPKNATWLKVQSYRNGKKVGNLLTFTLKDFMATAED